MLTLDDVKRIRKNAGVDNSNANKNYIFTKNTPKIKLNDEALSKTFGVKISTENKNSYEEKIKELGREDKIDYYSDLWDLQSDLSNKSKYTKKDYGRKKPTAEEYYNDLINAKENRNILEEAGIKINQLGEKLGSSLLGYGEGNGAGGLVKLTQNQLIKSEAYRQAVLDYKDGLISEDEISKRTKEYEKDAEENLSSATENINTMYESLGNHQVARNIGNIAGTIGGGITMTSLGASAPLVYGGQSALKKYGETDDLGDVAFTGARGAVYGIINNKIGNAVSQTIGKLFPKTASNIVANIAKNSITGGASAYGANALTGEAENIYNKARNRKVTKEDWINPIWSNETLTNFVIGGIIGGVTGTARDIKNAKVEAQRIGKELVKYLEKSAKSMKEAAQKGDLETARNINKQAQVVIEEFSNKTLLVYRLNENTKNLLINLWANEANEASILYNPTALNDGTNNVSTASSTNVPYMQGISGFIPGSNKVTPSIGQISSNNANNVNVPQNASNNVSELPQNATNTVQGKVTIPTNKNQNLMPNNANIQSLEDYTEQDIKDIVSDYIQDLDTGVKIKDIALNGSRARGDSKATSDLDVVVEYEGDIAEDSLFNELNKEPLIIDGIKVDINPITASKSGTLEEYMKKSKSYDEQQNLTKNNANMNDKNFNERHKNALQQAQLDKIRENISDIINNINVEDGIFVTNSESRASADANYIEVYNEKTDESKTIRVANHYKDGVSGEADYNIYIDEFDDMNKLNVAIEDTIDKAMKSINTPGKTESLVKTGTKTSASENLTANDSVQSKSTNKNVTARSKTKAEKIEDFGEKIGGARKDLWVGTTRHAKKEVIPNYSIARDITTNEDGTEITDYSVKFKGETLKSGLKTEKEAEEFINSFKSSLKANRATVKKSEYFQNEDGTDAYEIVVTDPKTLKKSSTGKIFYDKAEAESYAMALSMYLSENGKNIGRPAIQVITRINPEFANTKKATGQDILDDFKFRAGEFGNWVSNAERQKFLNYCYDALTDLAIVLDVPLDNISYRGKMAIAFGARGRGLVGAAAHFEPDAKVINMTRLKGAGSLAHEMGHALDNYLSQISGYDENELLSTHSSYGKLPEKVKEAYRGLLDAIQYNTSTNQEEIDKKNRIYEKNRKESLEYYLKYYDEVFKGEASTYKKVKGKYEKVPIKVTDEQKQEYQRIRNILFDGKLENKLEFNSGEPGKSWTYAEPLETLRKLIKEVTNKKANNDTLYSIYTYGKQSKEVKEVKSQSAFSKAALELDRVLGRATAYASTIQEKIARSFEAFIYDELEKKGITDTYLVHSVHNRDYALFNPFPAGEERTKINTAWRNLINAMKDEALFDESSTIVFEPQEKYSVDIMSENDYNNYTIERKKEPSNYVYKKITNEDRARVNSDYMTNKIKYADDVGIINFDDTSYAYEKTDDGVNVLLKFKGSQNYIKGVTEYVRTNSNTRPKGYNRYVEIARSRYENNNISDADGRRTKKSEESDVETDRIRQRRRNDDSTKTFENNGNNLKNSKQSSFSLSKDNLKLKESSEEYNIDDKTLVATHNITEEKMKGILELGGFPVPSIAISDISKGTQTEFGEITIFFDKETINPVDKRNEVYDRDVWSPTFPYVEYEINEDKARDIAKDIGISEGMLVVDAQYGNGYERLIKRLLYHDKVLDKYVQENNLDTEFKKIFSDDERRKFAKENGIEDYLREKLDGIYKERGILNSKGYLTPSGKRRKFWQAHDEYNLENLVKIMVKGETKGKQDTPWQIGNFGRISAQFGKKFKSIEDIKSSKARLQTSEELKAIEELRDKTYKDINELSDITSEYDYVREAIENFAQKYQKNLTIDNFKKVLKDYNIKEYQINDELLQRIIDDLEQLKAIPTDYFESKPQRAVGFEEVRAVLVPATIDEELKQQLIDKGLNVVEYDPELKGDREAKYNELAQPYLFEPNTKYSRETSTETPIKVLKSTEKISKPQVVGQRIWEGFKKQGYIDLNGKTVRNSQDVAELSQIFRNPKYETFRVIYTNGNTIVGQEAVTSYLPGISKVSVEKDIAKIYYKMQDRMKRLNANGYYLVHNHPAGTAKASLSDIKTTENISENVKGFKGHVVVDHGTYAFISKDDFGMRWQNEIKVDDKNALYKGSQFETKLLSNKIPWNNIKINNRSDFASLMHNLKNSTDYSTLVLCDAKKNINAIIDVPNKFFNMRLPHVEGYIKNVSKKYGAVDAFAGTSSEDTFNKIKQLTNLRDIVLYQDNTEKFGEEKGNSVFNYKNTFGMRTAEETQEERKERVQKYIEEMQETIGTLGAKVDRKAIVDKIVNEYGIVQKGNSKELNRVSKEIQNLIEQGALTDSKIENYAEELIDNLRITVNDYYNANKELKELIRRTKLYASDTVKNGFGQWEEFRKQNIGTLRLTNDTEALPVDTFYKELTEMYGESIFPSDIANTSDQLEKISEVAKSIKKIDQTLRENIEENFGEEAREEIVKGLVENLKTLREKAKQSSFTNEEVPPDTEIKKRSWTKTVRKNDMVSTFLDIKDMKYVVKGNKGTVARANDILESEGYENSLKHFESIVESGKFPTVDEIALGERLIQESIKLGKFEKATELVSDVSILGTELGQSVQAMSIIHRLSPTGQLMHLKRAVNRMNKTQIGKGSSTSKLPKEIRKNSKLKEMVDKIVTGEQSKLKLKEEMQGKFDVNDIIDKIEKGEQEKIELPKEIKDNSDLMELITKIEKGEQTKIELQKETKSNTELGKIVTKVIDGEQTKIDLGITDEAISEKKKFKKGKIELTPEMELAILCSQTPEELEIAVTRVKEQLAIQMPVSFGDKLQAWRYLSMLGNVKTHLRNIAGNTVMKLPYSMKNVFQRALETMLDDKLEERTRTFKRATKEVKEFAEQMLAENKDPLTGNGYSNIQSELMDMRKIFKHKSLEWLKKNNSDLLSFEDFLAKKGVFKKALAEYLTANGIKTNQDIKNNQELVQKAANFAISEAQKATFNQYNALASAINKFENSNELTKIAIGGIAPFKRTPINIVKTSLQYNPLGLAETLIIEAKKLKKGEITGNEFIERISQGLTGVSITLLGILLASLGIISASGGSKEDKYKETIGMFRPYSINIGKVHIDITWLSPAAVPLLMGAEVYENTKGKDKSVWERILDGGEALSRVLNPISETTMLSSLNDAFSNYGGELSFDALGEVIKSIISSYISQAFPTLGNQVNRLIDPTIRSTAVSKNSKASFVESIIRQNMNKIPGANYLLEPSIDIWGNVKKRSDNAVLRGIDAFVNPANITIDKSTQVDKEILRLYHINENDKILPKTTVNKYFSVKSIKYEMNAKEYTQFKIDYGKTAYDKLKKLFKTNEYLKMSDTEKEKAIEEAYDIAIDIAKYRYMTDKYGEKGVEKLLDDNTYRKYTNVKKIANLNYEEYLESYYSRKGIEADKNKKRRNYKRFKV